MRGFLLYIVYFFLPLDGVYARAIRGSVTSRTTVHFQYCAAAWESVSALPVLTLLPFSVNAALKDGRLLLVITKIRPVPTLPSVTNPI